MGCEVVVGGASRDELTAIEQLFAARDRTFSRFIEDSELNHVNASAGRPLEVSREFAEMLALGLEAARQTDGLVDPTLGLALELAGYDRDFTELPHDRPAPTRRATGNWTAVLLAGRQLAFPASVQLDLNGVVKAKTVDDVLAVVEGVVFVSAGGDIAVRGGAVVGLPGGGAVKVARGALATSGTDRRRWLRGGALQHHLIDPRTGSPSTSRWQQVTASGASCVAADILARAAFLLDDDGPAWLDAHGVPGRFLAEDGSVQTNETWQRSVERRVECT